MKKIHSVKMKNVFIWPNQPDIDRVPINTIQEALTDPKPVRRGRYCFESLNSILYKNLK